MVHPRVWALSGLWSLVLLGQAVGFDQVCGVLPGWSSAPTAQRSPVVTVHATGRATGTYMAQQEAGPRWRLGMGHFTSTGHGVLVGSFVVTAAHVVYPSKVEIPVHQWGAILTPVVSIVESTVTVRVQQEAGAIPADIVHLNHHADLAILYPKTPTAVQPLEYPATETWLPEIACS